MKRKGGIFRMLVVSYIVFAILVVISFGIALVSAAIIFEDGNPTGFDPYSLIDGNSQDIEFLTNMGAWAEGLDDSYHVVTVIGEKRDTPYSYSQSEIFDLLNAFPQKGDGQYHSVIREAVAESGIRWWLVKVPADDMVLNLTIELNSTGTFNNYFFLFLLLFLLLFVLNCILLSLYLSRKIKKPLAIINSGLEKIRSGEQNVRLDEFKAQAEFLNIRDSFHYMSQKLFEEKQAKERSEQRKNRLLTDLSHDIKTPAATIKAYANALAEGLVESDKNDSYLKVIDAKADRVSDLANDLFTVLSMENEAFKLTIEPTDIAELFRELCAGLIDEAEAKNLTLKADIPDTVLEIPVDKRLISRALYNLLDNAIKYNITGKLIIASINTYPDCISIEVADDGNEISEEYRETIFDAFVRVDQARTSTSGTGLGLAIVNGIVMRHGGEIKYIRKDGMNIFKIWLKNHIEFSALP